MNKCEKFLDYFDSLVKDVNELPREVKEFYDILRSTQDTYKEKPAFTETGVKILSFLKSLEGSKGMKSNEIAEQMGLAPKTVSGSIRKLVNDGYVEKFGKSPVVYNISEKGKNINFEGDNV